MKVNLKALLFGILSLTTTALSIKVGDTIPSDTFFHFGFPPEKIDISKRVANKNVLLIGLPGAFTPTWSSRQVPGYLAQEDALKSIGVDEVLIYCVNDGAVMEAWSDSLGVPNDSMIKLMGDPFGDVTEKLDMEMLHSGPKSVGLINRCKRFALYVVDGVVQIVNIAEAEDDPAGDDRPDVTLAEAMIDAIKSLKSTNGSEL